MIPILFDSDATTFDSNGIGRLSEATSCIVNEERNGVFNLTMQYPIDGKFYSEIQNERIIVAIPFEGGTRQAFVINNITPSSDGTCVITANHISYRANFIPVLPFSATGITDVINTLNGVGGALLEPSPFTITTDVVNPSSYYQSLIPKSLRSCLGGDEGSILDVFASKGHCEYEWDNFNIILHYSRGNNTGYTIRYGKNLLSAEREISSDDLITGALGYWVNYETQEVVRGSIQYSDDADLLPYHKTVAIDFSAEFEEEPALSQLNALAKQYADNNAYFSDSVSLQFYDQKDQNVHLCDTINVYYEKLGINLSMKIIATEWNVLLDRYNYITVGSNTSSLADTLYNSMQTIVNNTNNQMISITRKIDYETGEITQSVRDLQEDVSDHETRITQNATAISTEVTNRTNGDSALSTRITQNAEAISTEVESRQSGDSALSTRITQNSNSITAEITNRQNADEAYQNEVRKYIRFDDNWIEIGETGNQFKTHVTNTEVSFTGSDGNKSAGISYNLFYCQSFKLGNWHLTIGNNNVLNFTYGG